MKASDLKQGDFFKLTPRKNARVRQAHILEVVTGSQWQNVINNGRVKEGHLFIMGECGSIYRGQLVMDPETEIFPVDLP